MRSSNKGKWEKEKKRIKTLKKADLKTDLKKKDGPICFI